MNIYIFAIITSSLCILCCLCMIYYYRRYSVINEHFTQRFFTSIKPTHYIGIDQSQVSGNERVVIDCINQMLPFNMESLVIDNEMDQYIHLNNNKIQFILSRSNEIYNLLYKMTPKFANINIDNIRFVSTLFDIPLNILTTNMNINEFGDLKNSKLTVNVGPKYSIEYFVAIDLILQYQLIINQDICITYYDTNTLLDHYGLDVHVVLIIRTHPDKTILSLINHKLTKLIEIQKYNDGNIYQLSLREEPFYNSYPYFDKHIIDTSVMKEYYNNLAINQKIKQFINTISLKYYLLSNIQTPQASIYQLLHNIKLNIYKLNKYEFVNPKINISRLGDFTMSLPIHPGASQFYYNSGLYTNIHNPNCIMINGRCNEQLLNEHHM